MDKVGKMYKHDIQLNNTTNNFEKYYIDKKDKIEQYKIFLRTLNNMLSEKELEIIQNIEKEYHDNIYQNDWKFKTVFLDINNKNYYYDYDTYCKCEERCVSSEDEL